MRKITLLTLISILLVLLLCSQSGNRDKAIEIHFLDISNISNEIIEKYDIQFSTKENCYILWIHTDGYRQFDTELCNYLGYVDSVVNREAVKLGLIYTDYINVYIESDTTGEFGIDTGEKIYRNIRFYEAKTETFDTLNLKLKREIYEEINNLN